MNRSLIPFLFALLILIPGCQNDDPVAPILENTLLTNGVYILNEGGFTKSNASLTFYVPDSGKVYPDVFFAANNRGLGDVANDIVLFGSQAFIVVNNSNRVEVISTVDHKSVKALNLPGNSPNRLVIVNASKGYITNLYKGTVTAFDPTSVTVTKDNINVGQNPQGLVAAGGKVFVCNSGYGADSTISVIDPAKDSVIKTITVAVSPTDIAVDSDGDIIVLSYGSYDFIDPTKDQPGGIAVIDPATMSVKKRIPLPLNVYGHPSELTVSSKGYAYFFGTSGVVKFDTKTDAVVAGTVVARQGYSLAVDDVTDRIYIGDARDYSSSGRLYIHSRTGTLIDSVSTGVIPGKIVFKR